MASKLRQLAPICILVLISTLLISDTSARITTSPQNVIVLEGENATLHCSSDAGLSQRNNPITWTYDGDIKASSCVSHNRDVFLVYSPNSTTDCNLVVLPGGGRLVAGPYACDDSSRNSRRALAMVIALDSQPVCGPVVPRSSVAENEAVDFTCSMTYEWLPPNSNNFPRVDVSFGWESSSDTPSTKQLSRHQPGGAEQANMTVAGARKPLIPAQKCTISFAFAPQPHLTGRITFADNPVTYTCETDPIPVRHCPSSVKVIPSGGPFEVGDVLTCTSDGYPEPSYTWTDSNGVVVSNGPKITLTNSSFVLNCTATGDLTEDCSASVEVDGLDIVTTMPIMTTRPTTVEVRTTTRSDTRESSTPWQISVFYASPRQHVITGGTTAYIHGTGLNGVKEARLNVTMIYTRLNSSGNIVTEETNFYSKPCVDGRFTRLTCVMPSIQLPEEFSNLSDPSLTFPYNKLSVHSSPVTSYNDRNSTLDFTESVLLDDVTYRLNESFDFQFINLFPTIIDSGPYTLDKRSINIQGMHLDRGVTRAADYTVLLGDGRCEPRDELNSTMFQCSPPTSAPKSTNVDNSRCNGSLALMVRLGDRPLGSAGCLFYPDAVSGEPSTDAAGRSLPLIVIVGSIGIALILLLTLVVLRAYVRQRRGVDEDRKPLDRHKDENGTMNGHAVNGVETYANHDQYRPTPDTMEMSEYSNATEFRQHPRRITSEIGYY